MDKEEKRKLKAERNWQKLVNKFLRMARVPKNATNEQTKACILHYVRRMKRDFWKVFLPDSLCNDPEFLLQLYKANLEMAYFQSPRGSKLLSNVDFMIEFVKLADKREMQGCMYRKESALKDILSYREKAFENPKFIERLAQEFPDVNVIKIIKEVINKRLRMWPKAEERQQAKEKINRIISSLPNELLCNQVKTFGLEALKLIPNDVSDFNKIVGVGIEKDGFEALRCLDIEQVLENKDLVIKAYQKDGLDALNDYMNRTLSPERAIDYGCHGELHTYYEFDARYAIVQRALLEDPDFMSEVFELEEQKKADPLKPLENLKIEVNPSLTNK